MPKQPTTKDYLAKLPADRRKAVEAILAVIRKNIDKKFEEGIQYGMPAWYVPHSLYPDGYHCDPKQPLPFASVASQKGHIGLYLFCVYMNSELSDWFVSEWKKTGKRLDMGKSCFRIKKLEDAPLELIGRIFKKVKAKDFIATYEESRAQGSTGKPTAKKKAKKKATAKKATKKKPAAKKATKKVSKKTKKKAAR